MKKIIIVLSIVLSGVFSGCTKMKVETANVQGEWKLESFYGVEAAGSVAQEVYVDFKSDGSFELFQKLGDAGHFRYFKGSYSLNGTVLSGVYSDGTPWATDYSAKNDADKLRLTSTLSSGAGEYVYVKTTIPQSVRKDAEDYGTKAQGFEIERPVL